MENKKNINILDLYFRRKNNKKKLTNQLILSTPLRVKSKHFIYYSSGNINIKTPKNIFEENNNILKNNKEEEMKLKIKKYKKILLPSLSTNLFKNKNIINSESKNSYIDKPRIVKIKKIVNFSPDNTKNIHRKLKELYKENFIKKIKMEKYKEKKNHNIKYFSFEDYNEHLLELSSINLSEDNFNIFKKNMECIQKDYNGKSTLSNKFKMFEIKNRNIFLSLSQDKKNKKHYLD